MVYLELMTRRLSKTHRKPAKTQVYKKTLHIKISQAHSLDFGFKANVNLTRFFNVRLKV